MARQCTVCAHPDRHAIERAMVDRQSNRRIATQFDLTEASIRRHKNEHFPQELAESGILHPAVPESSQQSQPATIQEYATQRQIEQRGHEVDVVVELGLQLDRMGRMFDAIDDWLRDPDSPERYTLAPRSHEIQVVYEDYGDVTPSGTPRRKSESLDTLLHHVAEQSDGMIRPVHSESRIADPRKLLGETAAELRQQMQLRITLAEKLYGAEQSRRFEQAVLTAIAEAAPDVQRAISERLQRTLNQPASAPLGPH